MWLELGDVIDYVWCVFSLEREEKEKKKRKVLIGWYI